jgi:hypothetical protein
LSFTKKIKLKLSRNIFYRDKSKQISNFKLFLYFLNAGSTKFNFKFLTPLKIHISVTVLTTPINGQ